MNKLDQRLDEIDEVDYSLEIEVQKRLDNLTKPPGSLGRLEDLAKTVVIITQKENPSLKKKIIFTMAGDHGVSDEGVSAFPKEVTAQMVYNFLSGGAAINVLASHADAKVVVVDMGVAQDLEKNENLYDKKINFGTKNISIGPAMTREEAIKSIEAGIEVFENEYENGIDILGTGDMGIGNTTASSAIAAVITGKHVEELTGRGTGIDDDSLNNKINVIKKALEINMPFNDNGIDILSKVGGFEIGGIAGVIIAAASHKVPIVIDGFISGAAALIAVNIEPKIKDYLIASHSSVEQGHKHILDYLGLSPIFDLNLRLGEGTGAVLAFNLIDSSLKILKEMATFTKAGVTNKE